MTRFWWVRHGPTHAQVMTGWRDVPADLSDAGALGRLDAYLPGGAVLVASDLIRASRTADALGSGRERLADRATLREFHFGEWEGLDFSDVSGRYPDLSRRYWEEPGDAAPPGGESWNALAGRVGAEVSRLIAGHGGRDIVVVAHLGVILTQVETAMGCGAAKALGQRIEPLSVTELSFGPEGWRIGRINQLP